MYVQKHKYLSPQDKDMNNEKHILNSYISYL